MVDGYKESYEGGAARVSIEPRPAVNPGALSESVPLGNLAPGAY